MEGVTCLRLPTHPLRHAIPDITVTVKQVGEYMQHISVTCYKLTLGSPNYRYVCVV